MSLAFWVLNGVPGFWHVLTHGQLTSGNLAGHFRLDPFFGYFKGDYFSDIFRAFDAKDKSTGREVLTDIFVAWGHQQEKDSPLTVDEIAEFFDKLYEDAMASPPTEGTTFNPAQAQAAQAQMLGRLRAPPPPMAHPHPGGPPVPPPNPYFNAMYNMMHNPGMGAGMNPYLQHTFAAQQQAQAAAYAAYQQQMQQQYMQMYAADGGKGGGKWGKGFKGGGKGKSFEDGSQYQAPTSPAPAEGDAVKAEATAEGDASAVPDFSPPKPRLLQIVDPASGKPIDTIGMNFAPRKPSTPLQITNPKTGEAVAVEAEGKTSWESLPLDHRAHFQGFECWRDFRNSSSALSAALLYHKFWFPVLLLFQDTGFVVWAQAPKNGHRKKQKKRRAAAASRASWQLCWTQILFRKWKIDGQE